MTRITKLVEKFLADNSPTVLTAIGVTGTVTTAYLAGRASFKAAEILAYEGDDLENLKAKEALPIVWKLYIPAVSTGLLTVGCIITANRIGTRRAAAMAAAYTISERAFSEYKEKIIEKIGANKEQKFRDEIAQERVERKPSTKEVIIAGSGDVLCYDSYSGRYFTSTMENIKKAQNDLNYRILQDNYASLGDFYDLLRLQPTSISEDVGWTVENKLEIDFSTVLSDDGRPCIAIDFHTQPIRGYYKNW